jgi:hypothetical protein
MTTTARSSTIRHTPGPWNDDGQFIVAPDPKGVYPDIYVAEIVQEDSEGRLASPRQQKANAGLIALAPEMYKELQTLGECCREALSGDWDRSDDGFIAMLESIDATLAKANPTFNR